MSSCDRAREDNHWLDCLVGCAEAASMLGGVAEGVEAHKRARATIKLSELQAERQREGR